MAYVMILLILLCNATKGYCGKHVSSSVKNAGDSFQFSLLRMLLCTLIGLVLIIVEGSQRFLMVEQRMLWICILSGVANATFLVGWLLAVQRTTMVAIDVSLTLGSIIPSILCAILFGEAISLPKMFGFALILVATFVLAGHADQGKRIGLIGILLTLLATVGDGMCGFAQQLYKQFYTEAGSFANGLYYPKAVFHFYTYIFSGITFLLLFVFYRLRDAKKAGSKDMGKALAVSIPVKVMLHILIMAICLFAANYAQTLATSDYGMSSQVIYPVLKGGSLIVVNFTAMIFFGEKITVRSLCGSLIALAGIVSMSIL